MLKSSVASYKIFAKNGGYRFVFYCDLSGARVCTTEIYYRSTQEEALQAAWQSEGREHFNKCHKCGRWVIKTVYNADVLECVDCAPYECEPNFCKTCGIKIKKPGKNCPSCGNKLVYEGEDDAV